jgi:capsular polysaccharide biosynthesis protein
MNDNDPMVMLSLNKNNDPPSRFWADGNFTAADDAPEDFSPSLVSLGFIKAAVRRSRRLVVVMAAAGFLLGAAAYVASPHAAQATTRLVLTVGPESVPGTAIADDQAIAQSRAVAGLVVRKLKLPQSAESFLGSYTATPVTDRVLQLTVNAPSGDDAVTQANTLATEFLQYRAQQLKNAQQQTFAALDQQVAQAKQQISATRKQIAAALAQPRSPTRQGTLTRLRAQVTGENGALFVLQQNVNTTRAGAEATTAAEVNGSYVIDAAYLLPPPSKVKHLVVYAAVGLFAGLMLTLAFVVIRAVISDRLFRRDDVARALGAPVKLSVRAVRLSRWRPGRRGLAAARGTNARRIVTHLSKMMPTRSERATSLAIVPVDDPRVAALSLMSLAISYAQQGMQVVVADLASGAPAAGLTGSNKPGVGPVNAGDVRLIVAVPERDDVEPAGPLGRAFARDRRSPFTEAVQGACHSADILLTLAPLDPALGGEHLATWATDAVVFVTAGRSSWTKIRAVGEMVRLSGTRLVSAVLAGADKADDSLGVIPVADDSLGVIPVAEAAQDAQAATRTPHPDPGAPPPQSAELPQPTEARGSGRHYHHYKR